MTQAAVEKASGLDYMAVLQRSPVADNPHAEGIMRECVGMSSTMLVGRINGEIACLFGLINECLLVDRAYVWLLTTDLVNEHKFVFIRNSQRVLQKILETHSAIYGHCLVGDEKAIRWMKLLGAKFDQPDGGRVPFEISRWPIQ